MRAALVLGARACRRVQAQVQIASVAKSDGSPVTVADFASQAVVTRTLSQALGPVDLLAEESAEDFAALPAALQEAVAAAVRPDWPQADAASVQEALAGAGGVRNGSGFWTLDPLDGTKGFLRGGQYAIALARVEAGRPVLGGVAAPTLPADASSDPARPVSDGVLYLAVAGGGVQMTRSDQLDGPLRPLARSGHQGFVACMPVEAAHGDQELAEHVVARLDGASLRLDSQCKYLVVARGQADAYVRLPLGERREKVWDHAAGALVAAEAGCVVTDADGQPLDFTHGATLAANRGVVCASAAWHPRVLEALRQAVGSR